MLLPFWGLWQAYHEANPNSCISQRNILLSYQRRVVGTKSTTSKPYSLYKYYIIFIPVCKEYFCFLSPVSIPFPGFS